MALAARSLAVEKFSSPISGLYLIKLLAMSLSSWSVTCVAPAPRAVAPDVGGIGSGAAAGGLPPVGGGGVGSGGMGILLLGLILTPGKGVAGITGTIGG